MILPTIKTWSSYANMRMRFWLTMSRSADDPVPYIRTIVRSQPSNLEHFRSRMAAFSSLGLDPQFLDDRPPFLGIDHLKRGQRFGSLLLGRRNFLTDIDQSSP